MPTASPTTTPSSTHSSQSGLYKDSLSKTNLYIKGLTPETSDKDLINLCNQYGKITSTKAIIDPTTTKCKGYGFVDFESPLAASKAVQSLQEKGVQVQMARVSANQQEQDPTNLYIANLPGDIKEDNLEMYFASFGTVISTRVLRDNKGFSKGVGFARMESKEKCEDIIKKFNGQYLPNSTDPLLVKFADSGNKKKLRQANAWKDGREGGMPGMSPYDQPSGVTHQNGGFYPPSSISPAMMSPAIMQRPFNMQATSSLPNYQVPSSNWGLQQQVIMQPQLQMLPPTSVHSGIGGVESAMMPLAQQMAQLQLTGPSYMSGPHGGYPPLAYQQAQAGPALMQTMVEDHNTGGGGDEQHYSYSQTVQAK